MAAKVVSRYFPDLKIFVWGSVIRPLVDLSILDVTTVALLKVQTADVEDSSESNS